MKRFFLNFLIFTPLVALIISVNYLADPANLFGKGNYEKKIADYLNKGFNVTNIVKNFDERLLQKYIIEDRLTCPEVILLGASKQMLINKSLIHENFVNHEVSGATLEDLLGIYSIYENKGCNIRKIIIGLEPLYLNENHGKTRWKSLENEFNVFAKKLNFEIEKPFFKTIKDLRLDIGNSTWFQLISPSYFQSSIHYLFNNSTNVDYWPTNETADFKTFTKLTDGSGDYGSSYKKQTSIEIRESLKYGILNAPGYSYRDFNTLSERYQSLFIKFIDYLKKRDIEVEFILAPYHPFFYDYFISNKYYHFVFESESFFQKVANDYDIKILGSYNPYKFELNQDDFYDGCHPTYKYVQMIYTAESNLSTQLK